MFDGVIFDMDGLMVDTEPVWMECWAPALAHFGYDVPPGLADAVRGSAGDNAARLLHEMVSSQLDTKAFWAYFSLLAEKVFAQGVEKKPGLDELLAYLGEQGVPCAVASSSSKEGIERNLRFIGHLDCFQVIVPGSEVPHAKPAPDVFLEAAKRLGTKPARTMVLEDSFNGVRAGAAGGFYTVMVPDLASPNDEIRSVASCVCPSLLKVRDLLAQGEMG
jgi:HAD superfamily hydrolase (TIGR01509 family)